MKSHVRVKLSVLSRERVLMLKQQLRDKYGVSVTRDQIVDAATRNVHAHEVYEALLDDARSMDDHQKHSRGK